MCADSLVAIAHYTHNWEVTLILAYRGEQFHSMSHQAPVGDVTNFYSESELFYPFLLNLNLGF